MVCFTFDISLKGFLSLNYMAKFGVFNIKGMLVQI